MWSQWKYSRTLREVFREKEREKRRLRDVPIHVQLVTTCRTMREIFTQKRQTRIKRRTYTPTISDKIGWHCYTHIETKREKEIRTKRRTYTCRINDNIPDTETDRQKERETRIKTCTYLREVSENIAEHWERYSERERERRIKKREYTPAYNAMTDKFSRTLLHIFRNKERKKKKREKKRSWDIYAHPMSLWNGNSEPKRWVGSTNHETYIYTLEL